MVNKMRILIAEDNDSKFARIKNCLEDEFKDLEITRFTYAKGIIIELKTLDDLNQNEYEFLIQDMQMPLNRNGSIDTKAGMYVFRQLERRQIKIKTICCSSEEVSFLNPYSYLNCPEFVLFSYTSCNWREDLINKMKNYRGNQK